MNTEFHKIEIDKWERKDEYEFFTQKGPCAFTLTANVDITGLYNYGKANEIKLYPLLVAAISRVLNSHKEFRYGWQDNSFGYYEVLHPLVFDMIVSTKNVKCLCAEYKSDLLEQVKEIESMREKYKYIDKHRPQVELPSNVVNISCLPWVNFSGLSFSLKYTAEYFTPIITFGKYEKENGKIIIPLSVYCNHAVNDGYHCSLLFNEFQELAKNI